MVDDKRNIKMYIVKSTFTYFIQNNIININIYVNFFYRLIIL